MAASLGPPASFLTKKFRCYMCVSCMLCAAYHVPLCDRSVGLCPKGGTMVSAAAYGPSGRRWPCTCARPVRRVCTFFFSIQFQKILIFSLFSQNWTSFSNLNPLCIDLTWIMRQNGPDSSIFLFSIVLLSSSLISEQLKSLVIVFNV